MNYSDGVEITTYERRLDDGLVLVTRACGDRCLLSSKLLLLLWV